MSNHISLEINEYIENAIAVTPPFLEKFSTRFPDSLVFITVENATYTSTYTERSNP